MPVPIVHGWHNKCSVAPCTTKQRYPIVKGQKNKGLQSKHSISAYPQFPKPFSRRRQNAWWISSTPQPARLGGRYGSSPFVFGCGFGFGFWFGLCFEFGFGFRLGIHRAAKLRTRYRATLGTRCQNGPHMDGARQPKNQSKHVSTVTQILRIG